MTHLTSLDELSHHITTLACVEETDAPFLSCYFNLEDGQNEWRALLDERARILRRLLKGDHLADLEGILPKVDMWLSSELLPEAKGAAVFVRGCSGGSFMLPMQFAVPVASRIAVYPTPNICQLVELKDSYHRYIVLLATSNRACILEVNLGSATIQAWIKQPALRTRVGPEWSRSRYQIHRTHRGDRFVQAKIAALKELMRSGGHTHLILAGDLEITRRLHHALPEELLDKLVDIVPADRAHQHDDVVMATLSSFIEHEQEESLSAVDRLFDGLRSHNLAVVGSASTMAALQDGEVDTLVMAGDYHPDPGWACTACKAIGTQAPETRVCRQCAAQTVRPLDVKESLLRLANQSDCTVEMVEQSDVLMSLGGVGCLLRSQLETQAAPTTEPV